MDYEYSNYDADIKNFLLLRCNLGKRDFTESDLKSVCGTFVGEKLREYLDNGIVCRTGAGGYRIACSIETLREYAAAGKAVSSAAEQHCDVSVEDILSSTWKWKFNPAECSPKTPAEWRRFLEEGKRHVESIMEENDDDGSFESGFAEIEDLDEIFDDDDDDEENYDTDGAPVETVKHIKGDFSDSVYITKCERGLKIVINGLHYRNGETAEFLMYCMNDDIYLSDFGAVGSMLKGEAFEEFAERLEDTDFIVSGGEVILEITSKDTFCSLMQIYSVANAVIE